eukprot:6928997-Pyramimonas_sp.AAC.1
MRWMLRTVDVRGSRCKLRPGNARCRWELSAADMDALSSLPTQQRMVDGSFWLNPSGPYRTLEEKGGSPICKDATAQLLS